MKIKYIVEFNSVVEDEFELGKEEILYLPANGFERDDYIRALVELDAENVRSYGFDDTDIASVEWEEV